MRTESASSWPVSIFIAGDLLEAELECADFCDEVGLCVTVTPTNYIYSGGYQRGVIVGLINYPRFPTPKHKIGELAFRLGMRLREALDQESFSIQTPTTTVWFSWREADLAIAAGARSGETTEELARSEGRQSGGTKIPHRPENSNSTQKACE